MSADTWGTASARAFCALLRQPDLALGVDFDPVEFATPWRALAERYREWLDQAGSGNGDVSKRLVAFLIAIPDADLPELGVGSRAWVAKELQMARDAAPMPDGLFALAEVGAAYGVVFKAQLAADEPSSAANGRGRAVEQAWPAPLPLRGPKRPEFPVLSVLSDGRRFIDATATATQTPQDLAGMVMLGTLSAAVCGRAEIEVRAGWHEPLTLYVTTILPSGEGKSPVVSRATAPLRELERELAEDARQEVARGQALYRSAQKRLEAAERAAAKKDGSARYEAEEKVRDLADELAAMEYPRTPRILADVATPEALVSLLAAHERIAVVSAEGGIFDILAGRYSDGVANLDGVLKAWDGEAILVDRRGREAEHVERPILALCLAVQPQVMETLRDKPGMRGRGLAARFLFSVPESAMGTRELDPPPTPGDVTEAWSKTIRELARPSDRTDTTPRCLS